MGQLIVGSLAAGVAIGIGGIAYLITGSAWVFAIGLLIISIFGFSLFTGRVAYATLKTTPDLLLILLFNMIAAFIVGVLVHFMRPDLVLTASELAAAKLNESFWVIPRAILCNIMIFIAVFGWSNFPAPSNLLILVFATAIFVMCGFEHCIANAFYFGTALSTEIFPTILYLILNIIGNTIGGLLSFYTLKIVKPNDF